MPFRHGWCEFLAHRGELCVDGFLEYRAPQCELKPNEKVSVRSLQLAVLIARQNASRLGFFFFLMESIIS
jgi:hypothetical protein